MIKRGFERMSAIERMEMYKVRTNFLFTIFDILEKHNVTGFIDCGTLLGAYRDGEYIPWDSDADIGVKGEEMSEACLEELRSTFNIIHERRELDNFKFFKLVLRDKDGKDLKMNGVRMECDVYSYYPDGAFRVMRDFLHTWMHPVPAICIDNLDKIEWYGRMINIPSNTNLYLRQWYGNTWHTPIQSDELSPNRYLVKDWESHKRKELEDNLPNRIKETEQMDFTVKKTSGLF